MQVHGEKFMYGVSRAAVIQSWALCAFQQLLTELLKVKVHQRHVFVLLLQAQQHMKSVRKMNAAMQWGQAEGEKITCAVHAIVCLHHFKGFITTNIISNLPKGFFARSSQVAVI